MKNVALQPVALEAAEVTRTLARFVVSSQPSDLPAEVIHEASRGLLNWMGCALGAMHHETVTRARDALAPFFGAPQAQVVGHAERAAVLHAALLNGISSHVLDFDDTHVRAIHPSAPVLPAVLAFADWRGVSGLDLLHAYVLGVEVEERGGLSVFPEHYDRGYHITGTAGIFGAAAANGGYRLQREPIHDVESMSRSLHARRNQQGDRVPRG